MCVMLIFKENAYVQRRKDWKKKMVGWPREIELWVVLKVFILQSFGNVVK